MTCGQARGSVLNAGSRRSSHLQQRRRDEEIEIGQLLLGAMAFEEPAEDGDVAEAGDFVFASCRSDHPRC